MKVLVCWVACAAALAPVPATTAPQRLAVRCAAVSRRAAAAAACALAVAPPAVAVAAVIEGANQAGRAVGPMTKLDSGVRFVDIKVGDGAAAVPGSKVALQWVLRRSNGYLVVSSFGQLASGPDTGVLPVGDDRDKGPYIFTVGSGAAVAGLDAGVRGMKKGGVRRIVVPASLAYTLPVDKSPGPVPKDFGPRRQIDAELRRPDPENYFLFEVEAENVRPGSS